MEKQEGENHKGRERGIDTEGKIKSRRERNGKQKGGKK